MKIRVNPWLSTPTAGGEGCHAGCRSGDLGRKPELQWLQLIRSHRLSHSCPFVVQNHPFIRAHSCSFVVQNHPFIRAHSCSFVVQNHPFIRAHSCPFVVQNHPFIRAHACPFAVQNHPFIRVHSCPFVVQNHPVIRAYSCSFVVQNTRKPHQCPRQAPASDLTRSREETHTRTAKLKTNFVVRQNAHALRHRSPHQFAPVAAVPSDALR